MGNPNWTQEDRKGERKMKKKRKKRKTRHEIETGKEDWGGYDQDPSFAYMKFSENKSILL